MAEPDQVQYMGLLAEAYRRDPENPALKAWFAEDDKKSDGPPVESYRIVIMNFGNNEPRIVADSQTK